MSPQDRFSSQGNGQHSAFFRPMISIWMVPAIPVLLGIRIISGLGTWQHGNGLFCLQRSMGSRHMTKYIPVYSFSVSIIPDPCSPVIYHDLKSVSTIKKGWLHEPFKPLFCHFADRADSGGLLAGTEISADTTTPYREWQG